MSGMQDDENESIAVVSEEADGQNDDANSSDDNDHDVSSTTYDVGIEHDDTDYSDEEWNINESDPLPDHTAQQVLLNKYKLQKLFKDNLDTLQSEKKWFGINCQLKEEVGKAIRGLGDAYHGLNRLTDDLPKEIINDYHTELANNITGNKCVRKLCGVICKMYPRRYKIDSEKLIAEFEIILDILCGFADVSDAIAREAASEDVFVNKLAEILNHMMIAVHDDTLDHANAQLQKKAIECLQNLTMEERNFQALKDKNIVRILISYVDSKMAKDEFTLMALAILAEIMGEKECEAIQTDDIVDVLVSMLKRSIIGTASDSEDLGRWSTRKIIRTIRRLSRNDNYKRLFGNSDVLSILVKVAQKGNTRDKAEATSAIWALAFAEETQLKIIGNEEAMHLLETDRHSNNEIIAHNCKGTIWTMRNILQAIKRYSYLVPMNAEKDKKDDANGDDARDTNEMYEGKTQSHIMISYQWSDQKTLIKINDILKAKGYNVWMDIDNMRGSTLGSMADAVEKASIVLMCMSQKYKNSSNCRLEAEYAQEQGKTIIPLRMERGYMPDGWLGIIRGAKLFFEFSEKYPFDEKMKELLTEIGRYMTLKKEKQPNAFRTETGPVEGYTARQLKKQKSGPSISFVQLNQMKRAFAYFDKDKDNRLSVGELGNVLRTLGLNPTEDEIKDAMHKADLNRNGYVEYTEYIALLKSYMKDKEEIENELKLAFRIFSQKGADSQEGSGILQTKQLRKALTHLGEKLKKDEVNVMLDMMDTNEDGTVDIDEFVKHLCETVEWK